MLTQAVLGNRIRAALRRIVLFYSKISQTVERNVKRESSRARVELFKRRYRAKRMARARFEGTALVAAFVAKLVLK